MTRPLEAGGEAVLLGLQPKPDKALEQAGAPSLAAPGYLHSENTLNIARNLQGHFAEQLHSRRLWVTSRQCVVKPRVSACLRESQSFLGLSGALGKKKVEDVQERTSIFLSCAVRSDCLMFSVKWKKNHQHVVHICGRQWSVK